MKRNLLFVFLVVLVTTVSAQKYISKTGHVWFHGSTPLETIEAHLYQSASILDVSTGDIQFSLLNTSFAFKNALMQEHFNENYMESAKFPKSTFKGKVTDINSVNFKKDGVYNVQVSGDLTIHGVTKAKTVPGTIEIKDGLPVAKAKFKVPGNSHFMVLIAILLNKESVKGITLLPLDCLNILNLREPSYVFSYVPRPTPAMSQSVIP